MLNQSDRCTKKGITEGTTVSVIVPCYNERDNIRPLVQALITSLKGLNWEVIFVDDNSPDGTMTEIRKLAYRNSRVRGVCRLDRKGLSSAVIEGVMASSADIIVVMDADLQHDEAIIPTMIKDLIGGICDVAVGSRHVDGGSSSGFSNRWRCRLSNWGVVTAQKVLPAKIADPMSGFFALKRGLFDEVAASLSRLGFKILIDLLMSMPKTARVKEYPYQFRARYSGKSKLDIMTLVLFVAMLLDKLCYGLLPGRFIAFAVVGIIGVAVNVAVVMFLMSFGVGFSVSQLAGTYVAMAANFQLNNSFTYRDRRLSGNYYFIGFILFTIVCSIGALGNIGVARLLFHASTGWNEASAAGAIIGVVWNYAVSSTLIWQRHHS